MSKFNIINKFPFLLLFFKKGKAVLKKNHSYVLLYHSFSEYNRRYYINICSYEKFYNDILKLKENFSFSNDFSKLPFNNIFLTFDDGYKSILPILEFLEFNKIPSIVFLSGRVVNEEMLPKDKIFQVCRCVPKKTLLKFHNLKIKINSSNRLYRDYLGMHLNRYAINKLNYSEYLKEIDIFFNYYHNFVNYIDDDLKRLSKEDLKIIKGFKYCKIGSHAQYHYDLRRLKNNELHFEIDNSKKTLEAIFNNKDLEYFSCPYGFFNEEALACIKKSGYKKVFTTEQREINDGDIFFIPRIGVDDKIIEIL